MSYSLRMKYTVTISTTMNINSPYVYFRSEDDERTIKISNKPIIYIYVPTK